MDLNSLINQAGGIGAIAEQAGVDPATAETGIGALLPHVLNGVENQGLPPEAADPQLANQGAETSGGGLGGLGGLGGSGGLGGMLGGLLGGGAGGGLLSSIIGGGVGNQILGHIFGSKDASRDVAGQASQQTGIDPSVLKRLLPIVAGMVAMHYITHRKSAAGGAAADGSQQGGGGILGSILGN